ncbi:solute carrier family 22 member 5-like isoform X1 [Sphaeramia orbicularis]|uniref:solute carrier family 22 member 5-like isoform X1 n=1 Tax=Sphaeramia orbicularis TaxID=375764 RepID=UPI00117F403C|nr:solute carrier family 22 member 5-like isoform X1 [Sphaeramia orbicularis]
MKEYSEAIAFLGQWGRFQQMVFFLLCASIMPNGSGTFNLVFVADIPPHHCFVPDVNLTEDWLKAAIPVQVVNGRQELSRCSRYRLDVVRNLSAQGYVPGRDVNLTDLEQESCVDGWTYSTDIYQSTIVSEFDLVCSEEWKQPFTITVFNVGVILGSFFAGVLSDRFGRKPVLFATMAVQTVFGFIQAFSTSWIMFLIFLLIGGLGQMSNYLAALLLGAEILTSNVRVLYSSLGTNFGFAFGYMMLALFAYFLRDWKSLLLGLSLPTLVYIPLWWLIPESPRWLLSQGRVDEAEAIVRKAAKWNKVQAPQLIFEEYNENKTKTKPKKRSNMLDLVRTCNLRTITFVVCLVWLVNTIGYIALSYNTSQLHGDPFISCFLSALVELPAYVSTFLVLRYLPRKVCVIGFSLLAAASLYLIPLMPQSLPILNVVLELLGKYAFTTGAVLMFVYSSELYPTVLRNTASGTGSTVARMGNLTGPLLLKLSVFMKYLPHITLGSMTVVSAIAAVVLPETFGRPLPDTIQQMPTIKMLKCPCVNSEETKGHEDSPL